MKEIKDRLVNYKASTPSRWRAAAVSRSENKEWLRYSQSIAMMMLDKMEELGFTQKAVADRMGCSQQYISKILKGTENLSIETIAKIEAALNIRIFEPSLVMR